MNWLKRMNSVLDYIENNLDGEIKDSKIVMLSANSKGMFQRIFATITDMTLSEYIRKRKLTQAALDIQNTDAKIIDIAVKYGYNSANAFSSAFKSFHGITPSEARKSEIKLQSFQRFTLKLTLSIKGGNDMQYRIVENAEEILQKMVSKEHTYEHFQNVSEHNGVKCATDGIRVAVILPEGIADWDLQDAYFDTKDESVPKFELNRIFNERTDNSFTLELSKEQVAGLLGALNHFNDFNEDFKIKSSNNNALGVCLNINSMEIIRLSTAHELLNENGERIMAFNVKYLKEALNFIMCSDDESIEIYYNGNTSAFIMKSSRLYAAVLPMRL